MDKYEERVSKILEKKEVYDKAKKQKKKIIIQSTGIVMSLVIFISVLFILPHQTSIETKPENTTAFLSSESGDPETTLVYPESTTERPVKAESTTRFQSTVPSTRVNLTPGFEEEYSADTGSDYVPPLSDGDSGGDSGDYIDPYTTKYRRIYYSGGSSGLNTFFANLVSDEEYDEWMKQYYSKQPPNDGIFEVGEKIIEPTRMKIVDFVMYFDIPRDVFEEANNTWCHSRMIKWGDVPVMNPKDYKEQEEFEVYNVDIIYTFDDKIINAYYERGEYPFDTEEEYLEAIENDGYITQTEEFIMLEGFEKVTLPALPPDAKPTYIDFDWRSKRCR